MNLYGEELVFVGAAVIVCSVIFALIGLTVYIVRGKSIAHKIEKEYGKKPGIR